jgi:hypothetical protein
VTDLDQEEQEQLNNLAIFSSNEDPTTYDEASKHEIWRKAMNQEIESITNKVCSFGHFTNAGNHLVFVILKC